MAHAGGDSFRPGPEFSLPDEILSVIPTDPYDQLDLARKITSMAIASRATKLETETARLRQNLHEKDRRIEELEGKVAQLDAAYQDADLQLKITREDSMKVAKERDSLALTAKKLSRDLAKLEAFKRQLMQSLNEDNSPQQTETVDIGTYDKMVPKAYSTSGATTPVKLYEGQGSLSSWYPSSQQSSAANSPPKGRLPSGRTPRIDGKEFFRQVRSRLSLEQFNAFLANIKELNAQKQSREETLRKAGDIFGIENKDLFVSFQGLLSRKMQ